ncbi:cyclin-domain-containing protein [Geopyxis carbonaria]|nr:cyclin-domain-containing protein [Geopyxis carbonaria]
MTSPFTSPPPPYSPEHPHIILDHQKLPQTPSDPPPPLLSGDLAIESPKPRGMKGKDGDIFHMSPTTALTLLARSVELLVSMSGDGPPTPPASTPNTPGANTPGAPSDASVDDEHHDVHRSMESSFFFPAPSTSNSNNEEFDGVRMRQGGRMRQRDNEQPASPESLQLLESDSPRSVIHHGGVDDSLHYGTIKRKFWCKSVPETPLEEYLFRIHRFCPLSTAVYLAASYYLHRLSITDRIIPLTRLTAHRLVLAAVRIAAKTLEDLSYPHRRFAKVGGLTDLELSRLEVSFCFLMDFELKVDRGMLEAQVEILNSSVEAQVRMGKAGLVMDHRGEKFDDEDFP